MSARASYMQGGCLTSKSLTHAGRLGAIRSLRFSPDGALLAAAEPADFVTLFDAASGFKQAQEVRGGLRMMMPAPHAWGSWCK